MDGAIAELSRLLQEGGWACIAIVHPVNSAGHFQGDPEDISAPFVIPGSYLDTFRYHDDVERDGLAMNFQSEHRPLQSYSAALEAADLVIEAMREVTVDDPRDRWARIPLFLHIRVRRL